MHARMPERHLLDILKHAEHWARYTRHFGPPSGSDPKLAQAAQRYLFTVFIPQPSGINAKSITDEVLLRRIRTTRPLQ